MKKHHYVALAIVLSVALLAGSLTWLTRKVLPNVAIAHLAPLEEDQIIAPNGFAIVGYMDSKYKGHRVIRSFSVGWQGVGETWPHILFGIVLGAIAGYFMGLPKRKSIEFARKTLAHSNEILRTAERKESDAARKMSAAEAKESRNSERSAELDRREKELKPKWDEVEQFLTYAHTLIREADAEVAEKNEELAKAKATIRRLKRQKKEKTIDEADEQD